MTSSTRDGTGTDVLVVGGGPAGASAAYWLASFGHHVTVAERRTFPRSKGCGDLITPRAVRQLTDMGLAKPAAELGHRIESIRLRNHERERLLTWPSHPDLPSAALVARRRNLDELVLASADAAGAHLLSGYEAVEPIVERGFVRGAVLRTPDGDTRTVRAEYVVVADGANSSFGRSLGTFRTRDWPVAEAIRSYWRSPRHDDHRMEVCLDLTDRSDHALPGFGWVTPVGDGTVNIGVVMLSTARDFKGINIAHLLDSLVDDLAPRWGLEHDDPAGVMRVSRVPMGGSIKPTAGPTFVVAGDAAATVSPFLGTGIDAAYESGRLAADVVHEALDGAGPTALQRYPRLLEQARDAHHKLGRLWCRALGRPTVMRQFSAAAVRSSTIADTALRVMTASLRPNAHGPAEVAVRAASALAKAAPDA